MGSLMSGWDTPAQGIRAEKMRRNSSLTRGEIDAFWKSKKQTEEEHLRHVSSLSPLSPLSPRTQSILNVEIEEPKIRYQRSMSMPVNNTRGEEVKDQEESIKLEKIIQKNGWWTRSNLAFLNEPPVIVGEGPIYKYASHHYVTSKPNSNAGVGA